MKPAVVLPTYNEAENIGPLVRALLESTYRIVEYETGLEALAGLQRQEVDLGGQWEFVKVKDLATGPPADGWKTMAVPGLLNGINYERAWFRRRRLQRAGRRGCRAPSDCDA